jgi:hypothetical protein
VALCGFRSLRWGYMLNSVDGPVASPQESLPVPLACSKESVSCCVGATVAVAPTASTPVAVAP